MHASDSDLSSPPTQSLGAFFHSTTAVNKCKYTCKCHSYTVKFPFPVFPDQACKMAANVVSSGRQLADKCLPEYISTAMKTKDFFRGGGLGKGAARHNLEREEGLESPECVASCSKGNKSCGLKWVFIKTGCYGSRSCQVAKG